VHRFIRRSMALSSLGALTATVALAAAAPTVTTDPATNVAATTATLNGQVAPNGTATSYHFEYGASTAYGTATPTQGPLSANGKKAIKVSAAVAGLAPSTVYHYRLVASSTAGTTNGQDQTFTTAAPGTAPDSISIGASRRTVTFGGPVTISGTVAGANNAGVTVVLEQNPAPYTGGFTPTGQTATTNATGGYTFTVTPAKNTRYQVTAKGKKRPDSPIVGVNVRVKVALHLSDRTPKRGQLVRFSGTVLPAHTGTLVRIQRHTATGWRTVTTTRLVDATPVLGIARSKFSKRIRVTRSGVYRARVVPTDGDHVTGTSPRRSVRTH
jgi:hypothetical protein